MCTLSDGSVCDADKGWVDCQVEDGLKNCDVMKEPGKTKKEKQI